MSLRLSQILLVLFSAAGVSACGEPVAPADPPVPQARRVPNEATRNHKTVRNKRLPHLPHCAAMPAVTATAMIGPAGGTVYIGEHRLDIPRGSLPTPVTITAVAPSDTFALLQFQPDGLVFEKAALLTMSYKHCSVNRGTKVRLAHVDNDLLILEYLPSFDVDKRQQVIGVLGHFSNYAVAW